MASVREFTVDCKLSYTLLDDTHFLFHIHALNGMGQDVLQESLRLTPALEHEVHQNATYGHRTLRLKAAAGPLTLSYRARVAVHRPAPGFGAKENSNRGVAAFGPARPDADALLRIRPAGVGRRANVRGHAGGLPAHAGD